MLGLREQIHCDPARIGIAIADDDDLARAGNRVDADAAEDRALGGGDIGVARPDDLVDRRTRRRSVGDRGNRLRATDRESALATGQVRGSHHPRIELTTRRRPPHAAYFDPATATRKPTPPTS